MRAGIFQNSCESETVAGSIKQAELSCARPAADVMPLTREGPASACATRRPCGGAEQAGRAERRGHCCHREAENNAESIRSNNICSGYQAEGVDTRTRVCVCVGGGGLKLSNFPFGGMILAEPRRRGCSEGN